MKKELICISCPRGCRLTAEYSIEPTAGDISGNLCPRGASYAISELTDPRRIVTAVIPTGGEYRCVLPVRTDKPFPKARIAELLNLLYKTKINLPVSCGDIIIENVLGTGVNITASENRD